MNDDELPVRTKSAAIGLVLWLIGSMLGGAVFFYLVYLLRISMRRHH